MALDTTQRGVLRGMAQGMSVAVMLLVIGAWADPFSLVGHEAMSARLAVAVGASAAPALCLMVAVGRLASHRFFHAEDIEGSGLSAGSARARLLQALLQNTLEQAVLALVAYVLWAVVMPSSWLSVVPLAALAFVVGRLLFFAGYTRGAPARALGFTLCFYTSALMLVASAVAQIAALG
ncbi:MAPEG family protein [Larsenimonas rhizosphaerae]|uniref:MAPEG family protein n=1 Tax=Larsenimonas rhizosphaerae TaxID=2944682 RepID=UPI002033581A|nr:MAPEG family protein [Larsenimonas rhizosphaerae]MCM2131341.1 MAPEG family protein [Larsenimonas rhizosphaerae]